MENGYSHVSIFDSVVEIGIRIMPKCIIKVSLATIANF